MGFLVFLQCLHCSLFFLLLSDTHFPNASVVHADYVKPLYHLWQAASGNVVHFSRYAAGVTQVSSLYCRDGLAVADGVYVVEPRIA